MDQVVVLGYDLGARAGEVERVGLFCAAEVVEFEDQMLGEVGFVAPDDPAYARVDETEFVARCVDGLDAGEFKVPVCCQLILRRYKAFRRLTILARQHAHK